MTTTTTMTPLEAIAYLYGTLPARPELYDNSEHTAALLALGPLLGLNGPGYPAAITNADLTDAIDRAGLRLVTPDGWPAEGTHLVTAQLNQRLAERSSDG